LSAFSLRVPLQPRTIKKTNKKIIIVPLVWDVTVTTSLAESYVDTAAIRAGLVAEQAAHRKLTKYAELAPGYILQPIAVENLGSFDLSTSSFLSDLGSKIRTSSGDWRRQRNFIPFPAHLCSYSTFQFCASARLFHQGRSGPIAFQT